MIRAHATRLGLGLVAAAALAGCVGGAKRLSEEDRARLAPYVLAALPADVPTKVDVNFANKVHLLGWKIAPESAPPGSEVKLTFYWQCDEPVGEGWQLFTHVQFEGQDRFDNLDSVGTLRDVRDGVQVLGPSRWERGKVYVDEQTYRVPPGATGEGVVYVGIWKGNDRLHVVNGPSDGTHRAIAGKIRSGAARPERRARAEVPELVVYRLGAGETIAVDGKGDDKAWAAAASSGPFVDVGSGRAPTASPVQGEVKLAWDDKALYLLFDVKDPDVVGHFTSAAEQPNDFTATGQPKLWTKDTVEIMTDPDGDGDNKDYFEIQVNPQNRVFHSKFDAYNSPRAPGESGPFGHEDWDPGLKSAVVVRGTLDQKSDRDEGYVVEMAIPWTAYAKGAAKLPPAHGDTWRMNFYAMQDNGGVAWSPILGQGNFHKASRFGRVTWAVRGRPLGEPDDAGAPSGGAEDAGRPGPGPEAGARDASAPRRGVSAPRDGG